MNERSKFQQELLEARKALVRGKAALIEELDFAGKLRENVRRNPYIWVVGAGVGIFLLARFAGGRPKKGRGELAQEAVVSEVVAEKKVAQGKKKRNGFSLFGLVWKLGVFVFPLIRPKIEEFVKSSLLPQVLKKFNSEK